MVEGARLEIVCTSKGYREFESHSIRQSKKTPLWCFFCWQNEDRVRTHGRSEFDARAKGTRGVPVSEADEQVGCSEAK